ncbi:uncharacterized protein [Diabrotica undecimpunctata]|uniref:uncharacterized protein n=1 Tax=Diabrotica undecimpunctata TaxID=50387 RepID=UPI003B637F6F
MKIPLIYEELLTNINQAANVAIPKHSSIKEKNKSHIPKPWWNNHCQLAAENRKHAFINYKQNPTLQNLMEYKRLDAIAKKIFKQKKKKDWIDFCESLNSRTPIKDVWRKVNCFKNRKQANEVPIDPEDTWLQDLHRKIAPAWVPNDDTVQEHIQTGSMLSPILYILYNIDLEVSIPNHKKILQYADDGVLYTAGKLLSTCEDNLKVTLEIVNQYYEAIGLSILTQKLRKGRSSLEPLMILVNDIYLGFTHKYNTLATFLDITSAYDNVQINILEEKLINISLPTSFANFIKSAYSNRSVSLKINKEVSESRICRSGLPQGSILSPILYSLYTMEIENVISLKSKIIQYADDVIIYTSNKSEDKCIENINTEFIEIQKCLDNMGLSISESKTNIIFSRNRNNYQRPLTIGKYKLRISNSVKYLGLHLDRNLLWKDCIHQIIKKTSNSINILRAFCRAKWGADPNTALLFYKTMVRSIMDYGSQLYGTAADTHLNKIEIQQNKCLRVCLGYLKSTPINIIQAEAVEPPLKLRRQLLSRKFMIKTISKKASYLNSIHSLKVQVLTHRYWHFKKTPLIVETFSEIPDMTDILYSNQLPPVLIYLPEQIFSREIRTYYFESQEVASINQTKFNETKNKYWANYDSIFTDGSKSKEYTSCAFYHVEENTDKNLFYQRKLPYTLQN